MKSPLKDTNSMMPAYALATLIVIGSAISPDPIMNFTKWFSGATPETNTGVQPETPKL